MEFRQYERSKELTSCFICCLGCPRPWWSSWLCWCKRRTWTPGTPGCCWTKRPCCKYCKRSHQKHFVCLFSNYHSKHVTSLLIKAFFMHCREILVLRAPRETLGPKESLYVPYLLEINHKVERKGIVTLNSSASILRVTQDPREPQDLRERKAREDPLVSLVPLELQATVEQE